MKDNRNKGKNRDGSTGRFAKGTSGNPAGRPLGSRNRTSLLAEALENKQAELIELFIQSAFAGNALALKMCIDRLDPKPKDRPIVLQLSRTENPEQISTAMSTVLESVGEGEITPGEGQTLHSMLQIKLQALEKSDLERRVAALEARDQIPQAESESAQPVRGALILQATRPRPNDEDAG